MANGQREVSQDTLQAATQEMLASGYSPQQVHDFYANNPDAEVREMYTRTPGLGAPQQGFWGTVGREAEIGGTHLVGGAARLVPGYGSDWASSVESVAPPPATPGERAWANTAEDIGFAAPLAMAGGLGIGAATGALAGTTIPEALAYTAPYALSTVGGSALPEARRQYMPGLSGSPVGSALDLGLGVAGGGLTSGLGAMALRSGLEATGGNLNPAVRAAQQAHRASSQIPRYPASWAPAQGTTAGAASGVAHTIGSMAVGDIAQYVAHDILGLSGPTSLGIGMGAGVLFGGHKLLPSVSPATRIGALGGGLTEQATAPEMTLPDVNVTAPAPINQLTPQL